MSKKFQCLATHYGHGYAYGHYDLESNNEVEIMEELKERGYDDVIEIWDIEAQ
jgi:hypothetical protein